jgi:hypothetical protein
MVMGEMFGEPAHKKEQQEHFRKNRRLKKESCYFSTPKFPEFE